MGEGARKAVPFPKMGFHVVQRPLEPGWACVPASGFGGFRHVDKFREKGDGQVGQYVPAPLAGRRSHRQTGGKEPFENGGGGQRNGRALKREEGAR